MQKSTTTTRRALVTGLAGTAVAATGMATAAVATTGMPAGAAEPRSGPIDWSAALDRFTETLRLLRDRYITNGWHGVGVDEPLADQSLSYMRQSAAIGRAHDDDEGANALFNFMGAHGQNFDWILRGDPSGMIADAAARSPRAAMLPQDGDPVFAAIEAHRLAYARFDAADIEDNDAEFSAEGDAMVRLLSVTPTTAGGVVAMLRYIGKYMADHEAEPFSRFTDEFSEPAGTLFERLAGVLAGQGEA
jgi:hypothetical protein